MNYEIRFISIEGNIGSGKSTLLSNLKETLSKRTHTHVIFLQEPVEEWATIQDNNHVTILEKFYNDQDKYAFSFQIMAFITRLKLLKKVVENIKETEELCAREDIKTTWIIITERSLQTDKMVFAKMLYDSGKIEDINYKIYLHWFDAFAQDFVISKIIRVQADPDVCFERIKKRNRNGEKQIPLEYLQSCSNYHDAMYRDKSICKIQLTLDGNMDIYDNDHIMQDWIKTTEQFIYDTDNINTNTNTHHIIENMDILSGLKRNMQLK